MSEASYSFLPWLRAGMASEITRPDGSTTGEPRADVEVTLAIDAAGDRREVTAAVSLFGPGEVAGIDPRGIIRMAPKPGETDAEPNELPMVEIGQPDFPWRYTPAGPDGRTRVRPWLVLAVLADDEIEDEAPAGADGRLPAITVPSANALPRLDQSWAWAHVQTEGFDPAAETLADVVRSQPRRVRSRLLAARRLAPGTTYTAVLVPAFERGRRAGLREPLGEDVDGLAPAWGEGDTDVRLPVYHRWSFQTGDQGDFEQLARRLRARAVRPEIGQWDLDARAPDPALPPAATAMLSMQGALLSPASTPGPWDQGERAAFVQALAALLNQPADALEAEGEQRTVAPPLWGRWHAGRDRLQPDGADPRWFHELNADPRLRATAGLGAEVVRRNDEQLMAGAWDQVEGVIAANEALRRAQLAREAAVKIHANHLARLDGETFIQVSAPLHARFAASPVTVHQMLQGSPVPDGALDGQLRRVRRPAGPVRRRRQRTADRRAAPGLIGRLNEGELRARPPVPPPEGALVPGALVPEEPGISDKHEQGPEQAGRRFDVELRRGGVLGAAITPEQVDELEPRAGWRPGVATWLLEDDGGAVVHRPSPVGGGRPDDDPETVATVRRFRAAFADFIEDAEEVPGAGPVLRPVDLEEVGTSLLAKMDPRLTIPQGLRHRLTIGDWVTWEAEDPLEPIMAAPEFDRPMYEPVRELSQQWLLPGVGTIPPDTVTLVVSNQRFIEAYMAGLSHEMARELLYHEYPTDQRGTYFKQFWDSRGAMTPGGDLPDPERLRDIRPIHGWKEAQPLGSNTGRIPPPAADSVVLLVKGELLRRYPTTIVYVVRTVLAPDGRRTLGAAQRFPIFEGRLDPDISFFGFDLLTDEVRGTEGPSGDQGWYFVLAEHPSEPRFGLDADNGQYGAKPTSWNDLNWAHLAASQAELQQLTYVDLEAALPDTSAVVQGPADPPLAWQAAAGANGSELAWITLQRPFRVAIHGSDMLLNEGA